MSNALLFDFDGVIVDSYDATYKIMLHEDPGLTQASYKRWFDGNVATTVRSKLSPGAVKDFFKRYLQQATTLPIVPGMEQLIKAFAKDRQLFIVSATDTRSINAFLSQAGLNGYFTEVYGYEAGTNKTDKINDICSLYNVAKEECLFVTDTTGDVQEGLAAGVPTIAVGWGYHTIDELSAVTPTGLVRTPQELVIKIKELSV